MPGWWLALLGLVLGLCLLNKLLDPIRNQSAGFPTLPHLRLLAPGQRKTSPLEQHTNSKRVTHPRQLEASCAAVGFGGDAGWGLAMRIIHIVAYLYRGSMFL